MLMNIELILNFTVNHKRVILTSFRLQRIHKEVDPLVTWDKYNIKLFLKKCAFFTT